MSLRNSTMSDNLTQESGGGLTSFLGPVELHYVTVVDNQGGNLNQRIQNGFQDARQHISLDRTVVDGGDENCQVTGQEIVDPIAYFVSQDYNSLSDDSCANYLQEAHDQHNANAELGSLTDNGGPTLTHIPQEGSPLIDAAPCDFDFTNDQRNVERPQNEACDIGAVEVSSAATGPTPTPLPSPTPSPSPTPQPTATLPAAGAPGPAFKPVVTGGGLQPTIKVVPDHAYGSQKVTVSGNGVGGFDKIRIFSVEKGQTVGALETGITNNSYQAQFVIPLEMPVGPTQLCAAVAGTDAGELVCTPFTVDPMPAGSASGRIEGNNFSGWDAQVHLVDTRGRLVGTTPIDNGGNFQFNNVPPGVYQYTVGGQTGGAVPSGDLAVFPMYNTELPDLQLSDAIHCALRPRSSYLLLDRDSGSNANDQYASVVVAEKHPFPRAIENIRPDWSKFQREKFGYYISGVPRTEDFYAIPQVNGDVEKLVFRLYNADGSLVDEHTESAAPYTVQFRMGDLAPSSIHRNPYIEVTPYVNGVAICPANFEVQVLADPMSHAAFREVDSQTKWDKAANLYLFHGVIPNVPGLPFDFPVPPQSVEPIPHFGRFQNKADAGIYVNGLMTEDGIVWMQGVSARAELKLLSVPLLNPRNFASPPLPKADYSLDQLWNISFKLPPGGGRIPVVPKIELGVPFVETPVFSFFGLDLVAGSSAKASFEANLDGEVAPFAPWAKARLTPTGIGEGEITLGTGLGGVVSAGGGMGFGLQIDLPITAVVPPPAVSVEVCPSIYTFLHVYARAGWVRKDHYEELARWSDCFQPLTANDDDPLYTLDPPEFIASPSIAAASDGQILAAYVQNTAVSGPQRLQIMARFQDSKTGQWLAEQEISELGYSASTPVVGFAGSQRLPIVVWIANAYGDNVADILKDNPEAQINRQDIFYSWYENGSWSKPNRLTSDLLADGLPSLAGNSAEAVLTWIHDGDGDYKSRDDQRIAVSEFDPVSKQFGPVTLLTGGAEGFNAEPQVAFDGQVPYVVWVYDQDAELKTAGDRRLAVAHKSAGEWIVELPPNLPPAADSPAIVGGTNGVTIAFLVREAAKDGQIGYLGTNGALWTARQGSGEWHAAPLRGNAGEFVYAERPLLAVNETETLLAFRRFGEVSSNAGFGQLSLSTARGNGAFSAPVYLTDEAQQMWQPALAVNPLTQQAVLMHVERPAGDHMHLNRIEPIAAGESLMAVNKTSLSKAADPVAAVNVTATADPALDPLQLSEKVVDGKKTVTVTALLRNVGRNSAQEMSVKLYKGSVGSGVLLTTQKIAGPLNFNSHVPLEFELTDVSGKLNLYAEVTTSGENLSTANDRALVTIGELTAPRMHQVVTSEFTAGAFEVSWYPADGEFVNSYRILRSHDPGGPFELVGESMTAGFTDTLVGEGQTYCYAVQSYNGDAHLSAPSTAMCISTTLELYLPLIQR